MVAKNSKSWIVLSGQYGCFHGIQNSQTTGIVPRAVCSLHRAGSHLTIFWSSLQPFVGDWQFHISARLRKGLSKSKAEVSWLWFAASIKTPPTLVWSGSWKPWKSRFEEGGGRGFRLQLHVDNCISSFCWNGIPCFLLSQSTNNKAKIRKVMMMLMSIVLFKWLL